MRKSTILIVTSLVSLFSCNDQETKENKTSEYTEKGVLDVSKGLLNSINELNEMGNEMERLKEEMNRDSSLSFNFKIDTFRIDDTIKVIIADGK